MAGNPESLTDEDLVFERLHPYFAGIQRIYRFKNGYGLSLVNPPELHEFRFAWEAAVLRDVSEDGTEFTLTYDTPLTDDVVVFFSDEEANAFIHHAKFILEAIDD